MTQAKRILWPLAAGLVGAALLMLLYFGIVSWAESPQHAIELFWEDRWIVMPIILGFGGQMALYVILKKQLFVPVTHTGPSGALGSTGCGGSMKPKLLPILGLLFVAFLTACEAEQSGQLPVVSSAEKVGSESSVLPQTAALATAVDEQGAVSVAVTPVDLRESAPTLDFEVAMNTHSVDLSMDLAALARLTTDNGHSVTATLWDAVPGGHHVSGVLSFPATMEGAAVLAGASQLTVTIRGVDAPERTFVWSLTD